MIWIFCFLFLSCVCSGTVAQNAHKIPALTLQEYFNVLQPGKTALIYFSQSINSSVKHFLEQLEKCVETLKEYGITVAKVNCITESVPKYCTGESVLKKAYLFRGSLMLIDFPTDILFDVNAIIAHVLFAVLYNEVTYTSSYGSLQNIENSAKGKNNVIFVYVRAIGIPEHRAVMETAFVYGAKYQFVLTTEDSMLKDIGAEDSSNLQGRLWVCHCKMVTVSSQPCRRSELGQPLTTVNIHMYLKLMEDPLVIEASTEPEKISSVYLQLQLPLVLVITQKETYALDKANAEEIAWRLLGSAGVALLSRDRPGGVNIPATANVGIRTAKEGIPIKYFTAQDFEDIIALAKNKLDLEQNREYLEVDEDSTEDFDLDFQDDEVAEAVHRDRKREFGLELVESLTDESFAASVIEKKHVVVLFYTSWDAVSLAFLRSYSEVAREMKGKSIQTCLLTRLTCQQPLLQATVVTLHW